MKKESARGESCAAEPLTPERIEDFLAALGGKGRSAGSLESYRRILMGLYDYLPPEKLLTADTAPAWKAWLEEEGFALRTVNARVSVLNSFYQHIGRKEWRLDDFFHSIDNVQPELTRAEYLRLLQAARRMGKEKSYLLIKTLGGAGLRIQELPQLTAEAVQNGSVGLASHNGMRRRVLRIPDTLQKELLAYMRREGIETGPVFVTPDGASLCRSSVYHYVSCVSQVARVPDGKANPRCLWKMYQTTCDGIRSNIALLAEQAYDRLLEEEQHAVSWEQSV